MYPFSFTSGAARQYERLTKRNRELQLKIENMISIIRRDPFNLSRRFDIQKVTDATVARWRIRSGNYRIRYDLSGGRIIIHDVFHRGRGY